MVMVSDADRVREEEAVIEDAVEETALAFSFPFARADSYVSAGGEEVAGRGVDWSLGRAYNCVHRLAVSSC